jgi:hypothetical protein
MRSKVFAPQDKGGFTSQICNENYDAGWRARMVFHCKRCQRRMPETWLDVFCETCVEDVHAGLAMLLAHPWNNVVGWDDFFQLLPRWSVRDSPPRM